MRTPAQRGAIGNWLREERLARGWSNAATARGNLDRAGIRIAASVYAEWESGTRIPSEAQLERLEAFYGSRPGMSAIPDSQALITAMTGALLAQTQALSDVRGELAAIRETMTTAREGALAEREAMTDMLVDLGARLHALQVHAGIAVEVADQG